MSCDNRPRVYLAGPEVFLPDALAVGAAKARVCAEFGFEGLFPLDASLELQQLTKHEAARRIALANEALMNSCDALVANLTPFRGASMDPGTAYEIGFMRALGKPVLGYSNALGSLADRSRLFRLHAGVLPFDSDRADVEIEDFDLAENLMIAVAIHESGADIPMTEVAGSERMANLAGFRKCLAMLRQLLS
jgi:nucleoside 2-deoxyribosyltransferase